MSAIGRRLNAGPLGNAAIGTAIAAAATLLRVFLTPLVGTQAPYALHVPLIAMATWFAGAIGGLAATLVAAVTVNVFIVQPVSNPFAGEPLARLAAFVAVAFVLVWQVRRWRAANEGVRQLMEDGVRRETELRALMDAATESIWLIDRDGTIVAANATAVRRFNTTVEAVVGKRWQTIVPPELIATRQARYDEVYATRQPVRFADERAGVSFDHSLYPVLDAHGSVRATAVFSRDVTHERRLEQQLRRNAEELDSANRLKDEFLATLSHELRTPMNAILGWSRILTTTDPPEQMRRRGLDVIAQNATTQTRLIEDVLDMSRIVTGTFRVTMQPISIAPLVREAIESVTPAARAKNVTVTVTPVADATISADAARLQQVLWNLLSNALKYTPAGGRIDVTVRVDAGHAVIEVSDSGIGITPEFLPRVFDRFSQADSSVTREHSGLGIGLSIVRHIVELHGGTVTASSEGTGRGAVFGVSLPLHKPTGGTRPAADLVRSV